MQAALLSKKLAFEDISMASPKVFLLVLAIRVAGWFSVSYSLIALELDSS